MSDRLNWERDGADWPNREASRFVRVGGLTWHVQQFGQGPVLLLVHGTGAATHSWRALAPILASHFTVIAPDLPGHGFTGRPPAARFSLPAMAAALSDLLRAIGLGPELAVGHSAGAAILARMSLDRQIAPRGLFSLNGAFLPFRGVPGQIFSPVARLLASCMAVPRLFARRAAEPGVVERLIRDTGSTLEPEGVKLYGRLARNPGHVAAALSMMANWELRSLEYKLRRMAPPLVLVVGDRDRTVSPADAVRVRALVPSASIVSLPGLGHLAHEEQPRKVADIVTDFARSWRVLAA